MTTENAFTFVDLFAGAGGFTLGLTRAGGCLSSVAVDADKDCVQTFRTNFPRATVICRDVRDVSYPKRVDVVAAGPPCQGFSALNRGRTGDQRNILYAEVLRCVEETQPQIVLVENVARFLETEKATALTAALRQRGYVVQVGVVNAADYGVPQRRLRALLAATRCSTHAPWPRVTHGEGTPNRHRTVADAFAFLPTTPNGRNWHRAHQPSSQPERIRSIREGGARADLPVDLMLNCWRGTSGFGDVLGRLVWHKPAITIRTEFFRPEKGRFLHPTEDRPITVREAARLQSIPDAFTFPEEQTLTSVARQIGNAIPPRLAEAIGQAVASQLDDRRNGVSVPRLLPVVDTTD
jgi:DNA (cytosine-5)-methyltransferase 1